MSKPYRWFLILVLGSMVSSIALADSASFLQFQQDVPLTGGISRFDYQSFDPQTGMLYIAHMGAGQIIVFNTQQEKVSTILSGFPGVTGVLVVPELHRLYASVSRRHQIAVINTQSLKVEARIPAGNFPDAITYIPELNQLYVSDEMGGEETVVDVLKNKRVTSIKMGGEVGQSRYDPVSRMVFVVGQIKNELIVIDPQTRKIVKRIFLMGGKHPHGLYLDSNSQLAFIGCDKDSKLLVIDLKKFEEIGVSEVGKDPDIMAFDSQWGYLYVASESGLVSVFRVRDRKVEKIGDFNVGENAHSVEVNSQTHQLYFPLRKVGKGPVLRIMKPAN
jgi:hypothetical protein